MINFSYLISLDIFFLHLARAFKQAAVWVLFQNHSKVCEIHKKFLQQIKNYIEIFWSLTSHQFVKSSNFSDHFQTMAMAELVELFRWQYISVVYEESSYGTKVMMTVKIENHHFIKGDS